MKRIFSIACLAAAAATSCGRSVDLGGGEEAGAGGAGDRDDDATGGSLGGSAGSAVRGGSAGSRPRGGASGSGPRGGSHPGGNGFGGSAGDYPSGFGGVAGDAFPTGGLAGDYAAGRGGAGGDDVFPPGGSSGAGGDYPAGFGGVGGDWVPMSGRGGSGGTAGQPSALPTCITDLYEACWPFGSCSVDTADSTTCYESGVSIVSEPLTSNGLTCFGTRKRFYKADGSPCYSLEAGARQPGCEIGFQEWYGPDGTLVARASSYLGTMTPASCVEGPTVACDIGAGGAGTHCTWPSSDVCDPGQCTPPPP